MELYKVCNGNEFNKLLNGKKLYKLVHDDHKHHNFKYKLGLNIDTLKFDPSGECSGGGLYFTTLEYLFDYYLFHYFVYEIEIPNDSKVYIEEKKFKSNKIILKNKKNISDFFDGLDEKTIIQIIKNNGLLLKYIKNQTNKICLEAVKNNCYAFEYVKNQTEEISLEAIKQNCFLLKYVKNQTKKICLEAIKQNDIVIHYIK